MAGHLDEVLSRSYVYPRASSLGFRQRVRPVTMTGLSMARIAEGRLVKGWVKNDVMGL